MAVFTALALAGCDGPKVILGGSLPSFLLSYDNRYDQPDEAPTPVAKGISVFWHGVLRGGGDDVLSQFGFLAVPEPHFIPTDPWRTDPEISTSILKLGIWDLDVTVTPEGDRDEYYACPGIELTEQDPVKHVAFVRDEQGNLGCIETIDDTGTDGSRDDTGRSR